MNIYYDTSDGKTEGLCNMEKCLCELENFISETRDEKTRKIYLETIHEGRNLLREKMSELTAGI